MEKKFKKDNIHNIICLLISSLQPSVEKIINDINKMALKIGSIFKINLKLEILLYLISIKPPIILSSIIFLVRNVSKKYLPCPSVNIATIFSLEGDTLFRKQGIAIFVFYLARAVPTMTPPPVASARPATFTPIAIAPAVTAPAPAAAAPAAITGAAAIAKMPMPT